MINNNSIKIENQYIPCINWFKNSIKYTNIELLLNEHWQKMSFRNRCVVAGSNGLINLSIPIENGRNQKLFYKDVKIANTTNWQAQHWRTLVSCYGKTPFFEFYADDLRPFYENKFDYLFEYNFQLLLTINKYINDKQLVTIYSGEYEAALSNNVKYCTPRDFQLIEHPVVYTQNFEDKLGFQPNLCILDLLFMEGNNTFNLLNS